MYESFFGFVNRPFLPAPTLDRYYPSQSLEQTIHMASRAVARAEGPVAIFGGIGLGKSICCLRIAEHFRRSFEVVMLASSHLITRRALLQSLLFDLQMPFRDLNEGELRLTLMNRLQPSPEHPGEGLLLVVDEAQMLSFKLLEEIRILTNIMCNGLPRVRLVLCGTMKLEENLGHPQMESLNQRLAARCYLTPLSMEETSEYVKHKIELSGVAHSSVITSEAIESIYRGSDGIPRLIDRLADQSLLLAAQERQRPVSAALVGKAWGMLQQLPNPWSEPESIKAPIKSPAFVSQSNDPGQSVTISTTDSLVDTTTSDNPTTNIAAWFQSSTYQSSPAISMVVESTNVFPSDYHLEHEVHETNCASEEPEAIVEFGTLDESMDIQPSKALPWERDVEEYRLAPIPGMSQVDRPTPSSTSPGHSSTAPVSVFGSDFDEEFNLPVHSSSGYKSYSGVAFGNLNYDLQTTEQESTKSFELEEADDFLQPAVSVNWNFDKAVEASPFSPVQYSPAFASDSEPISNITPSQAETLERQVEAEMRELVSDLNMNAMSFDPMQTIIDSPRNIPSPSRMDRFVERDVVSFAEMSEQWSQRDGINRPSNRATNRSNNSGDDRDMLVVEEDLETMRGTAESVPNAPHRPVLHPYAKLFSNLRNS